MFKRIISLLFSLSFINAQIALPTFQAVHIPHNITSSSTVGPVIAGRYAQTGAILANGTVKFWGYNNYGQLGQGNTTRIGAGSGEMGDNLPAIDLGTGRTATAIASGRLMAMALLDNGTVKAWGYNAQGQLGQGNTNIIGDGSGEMGDNLPAIDLGTGRTATSIGAGLYHTGAILDNGTVKAWGYNAHGQLGQGNNSNIGDGSGEMGDNLPAIDLGTGRTATAISLGAYISVALLDNGTVKAWGYGNYGIVGQGNRQNIGDGSGEMGDNLAAIDLGTGRTATAIAAGNFHIVALLDNGTVKAWGYNTRGSLGQGNLSHIGDDAGEMGDNLPAIDLGTGRTATAIAAGAYHTIVILDNGTVKVWGYNIYGQLGQGNTNNMGDGAGEMGDNLSAIDLGTGRTATAIHGGYYSTIVRLDDGTIKVWGYNGQGQLGQGNTSNIGDGSGEMGDNLSAVDLSSSSDATLE
jgi:alpha-tubulin suppressor-like RCC1 family protein